MKIRNYQFIDYATQAYLVLIGLLLAASALQAPRYFVLSAAHAAAIVLVHRLVQAHARYPRNRLLDLLRHFYPILFFALFYRETGALNRLFVHGYVDRFFIDLEARLFGCQPALLLMDRLRQVWLSELLYLSYFGYYVMIAGVGLALYLKDRRHFMHYVSVVSFMFYVYYITFILLPVVGARVFHAPVPGFPQEGIAGFPAPPGDTVAHGPFFLIMQFIYANFEAHGAAFPSSHVAVALCTLYFSWRYLRPIRYVQAVAVVLLMISTVYCRYHYAVDVYAGVASGLLLLGIGEWLYRRLGPAPASPAPA